MFVSASVHAQTASYVNPLTQSVFISGGFEAQGISGSKIYLGTHNIGTLTLPVTGSGLIISSSNLPTDHYNFLKIGETELVDYNLLGTNQFYINNVDDFIVRSSSITDGGGLATNKLFEHNGSVFKVYSGLATPLEATSTTGVTSNVRTNIKAIPFSYTGGSNLYIPVFNGDPIASPIEIQHVGSNFFIRTTGSLNTSQLISGSGTGPALTISGGLVVHGGITGSLFGTASWAISASQAISASYAFNATSASYALSASNAFSSSYALSASFALSSSRAISASYAFNATSASYALSASNAFSSSYALSASYALNSTSASYAQTASKVSVIDNEATNALYPIIFSTPDTGSGVQLQSDESTFKYNPGAGKLFIGDGTQYTEIGSGSLSTIGTPVFSLLGAQADQIVNFGSDSQSGTRLNINQKIVNITNPVTASIISASQFTGSLFGTASWAISASQAVTASHVLSSSYALSASYAFNATSASYALSASHALTASSVNTLNQNVIINGELTAGTSSLANLTVTNNAVINGDLFVYGSSSVINVENLSIEDKFILVNSGALGTVPNEGGLIVQTSSSEGVAYGTALYYDQEVNRWLVAKSSSVAYNTTSIGVGGTTDYIVTVSASAGAPVGSPYNFGTGDSDYSVGQMYIQTDTSDIYIYA
jgi:hypothetical protein